MQVKKNIIHYKTLKIYKITEKTIKNTLKMNGWLTSYFKKGDK